MELKDSRGRHAAVWALTRPAAAAIMAAKFNFHTRPSGLKGPLLVVANHNSDWDPGFIVCAFREQMYFVASEHLMRLGTVSRLLSWLQAPIARQKGGSAVGTVREMLRRLRAGYSVCVFPEGNRSWDGATRPFPPAIGRLARASGATLVTYHIQGAYLSNPRWAGPSLRKGRVRGSIAGVYSSQTLQGMTDGEVTEAIARDIHEDAFARQREEPVSYAGKNTAEHLETLLFICPRCGAMHKMKSSGDRFYCGECGYEVTYLPTGFFAGRDMVFDSVRDWNLWQREKIGKLCLNAGDGVIFEDGGLELFSVETGRRAVPLGRGSLRLFRDALELPGGVTLPVKKITGISVRGASDLFIGSGGSNYQLCCGGVCCTSKYVTACSCLGSPAEYGV